MAEHLNADLPNTRRSVNSRSAGGVFLLVRGMMGVG